MFLRGIKLIMESKNIKLMVNCPKCSKKFNYYSSDFRPFCSDKCKLIDLGRWLDQSYAIPVQQAPSLSDDPRDFENQF